MANAVGSSGEALGGGGSKEDWVFYPTASPTVAFRNGTESLNRHFPSVPGKAEGRAGQLPGLSSRPVHRRLTGDSLKENYCPIIRNSLCFGTTKISMPNWSSNFLGSLDHSKRHLLM